jgi:hypothetical protein
MCWGINLFPMCIPFVTAQNHEKFNSFQHGFGLSLNGHVEKGNSLPQISSVVVSTKMCWGINLFPMCIPFVTAQNHENFNSFQHGFGL